MHLCIAKKCHLNHAIFRWWSSALFARRLCIYIVEMMMMMFAFLRTRVDIYEYIYRICTWKKIICIVALCLNESRRDQRSGCKWLHVFACSTEYKDRTWPKRSSTLRASLNNSIIWVDDGADVSKHKVYWAARLLFGIVGGFVYTLFGENGFVVYLMDCRWEENRNKLIFFNSSMQLKKLEPENYCILNYRWGPLITVSMWKNNISIIDFVFITNNINIFKSNEYIFKKYASEVIDGILLYIIQIKIIL